MEDPVLYGAVRDRANELFDSGKPNQWDTYKEAGEYVRQKYGSGNQLSEEPDADKDKPTSTEEKVQRKREIDTIPSATAKAQSTAKEDKKQSPSETVEEIRQSRVGQNY